MASITAAFGLLAVVAAQAPAATFDYLYVEANEGNSSGGHVAVRLADHVYHFQHDRGLLRLRRDPWRRFEHHYRTLENRGISVTRIETSPATYERLRDTFRDRYLVQDRELRHYRELRRETRLLERILTRTDGDPPARLAVPGAGFFEPATELGDSTDTRALAAIRERLTDRYGAAFLAERRSENVRPVTTAEPSPAGITPPGSPRSPTAEPLLPQRLAEWHAAAVAIDVLETPHRLRADRLIDASDRGGLRAGERARLRTAAAALAGSLPHLASSRRTDWGYPFLLGLARLVAIEHSLERGRLLLLDAIPPDANQVVLTSRRRRSLPALVVEAERDRDAAMDKMLAGSGFDEKAWSELETAASRVAELRRAHAGAPALQVQPGILMPRGEASVDLAPGRDFAPPQVEEMLRTARRRESEYGESLRQTYDYNLLSRNCVSEVFRTIETAMLEDGYAREQLRAASHRRLGGYVAPTAGLNFIPIVSAERVRSTYSVAAREELPSYRRFHVEEMRRRESPLRVDLRESNVWTSTLYTPNDDDGFFVFFTDRTVLLRPVLGAVNLAAGAAKSGVGLAAMPIDGGGSLRAGLSGMLFSLPELFFVNLRKGSNDYVPPEMRPPGTP